MRTKIIMFLALFMLLSIGLIGFWLVIWTPNPKIGTTYESFDVRVYHGGHPEILGTLTPRSAGAGAVYSLIKKKGGKWQRSLASYAPVVYLETREFSINIQRNAIIYGKKGGLLGPLVSPLSAAEFADVNKIILESLEATKGSR